MKWAKRTTEPYDVEREVAFAALGGWQATFRDALERYCKHCSSLPQRELARRPSVLLDFDLWSQPGAAARGMPLSGANIERAAEILAQRVQRGQSDPYAILGTIARECEK